QTRSRQRAQSGAASSHAHPHTPAGRHPALPTTLSTTGIGPPQKCRLEPLTPVIACLHRLVRPFARLRLWAEHRLCSFCGWLLPCARPTASFESVQLCGRPSASSGSVLLYVPLLVACGFLLPCVRLRVSCVLLRLSEQHRSRAGNVAYQMQSCILGCFVSMWMAMPM